MPSHAVTVISPSDVAGSGQTGPYPFDFFSAKCLAQGDSWFSIGSLPPGLTTNILAELQLTKSVVAVNCARPGKELVHMTDRVSDPAFVSLLAGRMQWRWDAILISGGGNDLIDVATNAPSVRPDQRLLATAAERPAGGPPADPAALGAYYLSEPGWAAFDSHMSEVFNNLVDLRDSGQNKDQPLFLHNYTYLMPRPAGAAPGFGPWLQPAMVAFDIPQPHWLPVITELIDRLTALFLRLIQQRQAADGAAALYLVDTRQAGLVLADPAATGLSGDYLNEIHPSTSGYVKLAAVWRQVIDPVI